MKAWNKRVRALDFRRMLGEESVLGGILPYIKDIFSNGNVPYIQSVFAGYKVNFRILMRYVYLVV